MSPVDRWLMISLKPLARYHKARRYEHIEWSRCASPPACRATRTAANTSGREKLGATGGKGASPISVKARRWFRKKLPDKTASGH